MNNKYSLKALLLCITAIICAGCTVEKPESMAELTIETTAEVTSPTELITICIKAFGLPKAFYFFKESSPFQVIFCPRVEYIFGKQASTLLRMKPIIAEKAVQIGKELILWT